MAAVVSSARTIVLSRSSIQLKSMSTRDEDELSLSHTELAAQYRHSQQSTGCLCWVDASSFTAKIARTIQCEVVDAIFHCLVGHWTIVSLPELEGWYWVGKSGV